MAEQPWNEIRPGIRLPGAHGRRRQAPVIFAAWSRGLETNRPNGRSSKGTRTGTPGRVRSGVSRPIKTGCTTWEATRGSGVRIGTIPRIRTVCCGVRRGILTTRSSCWRRVGTTLHPIIAALSSAFVAFWLKRLRARRSQPGRLKIQVVPVGDLILMVGDEFD